MSHDYSDRPPMRVSSRSLAPSDPGAATREATSAVATITEASAPLILRIDDQRRVIDSSGPITFPVPGEGHARNIPSSTKLTADGERQWFSMLRESIAGRPAQAEISFHRGRSLRTTRHCAWRETDGLLRVAITDVSDLEVLAHRGDLFERLASGEHVGLALLDPSGHMQWSSDGLDQMLCAGIRPARKAHIAALLGPRIRESERHNKLLQIGVGLRVGDPFSTECELESGRSIRVLFDPITHHGHHAGIALVIGDADGEEQSHTQIRELTTRLRIATEGAGLCLWDWDITANSLWWDYRMFDLYGVDPGEFESNYDAWRSRVHPDDLPRTEAALRYSIETARGFRSCFRILLPNGDIRYIDAVAGVETDDEGRVNRVVGVNLDVTEREISRHEENRATDMLHAAGDISGIGGWEYDSATRQLTWTDRVYDMHGLERGQQVTLDQAIAVYWDDAAREEIVESVRVALEDGLGFDKQLPIRHAKGHQVWLHSVGVPVRVDGRIVGVRGAVRDVTEERSRGVEQHQMRLAAEAANRAKGEFLANMSHEIRTPMTAILGYGDMLLEKELPEVDRTQAISAIRRNGEHLLNLINDLLDISKIDAGRLEVAIDPVDPIRLVDDLIESLRHRAEGSGLTLTAETSGAIPNSIQTDALRLRQILTNLIGNAINFTNTGSVRVIIDRAEDRIEFRVVDTGIGMSAETVERVFQPFVQADASIHRHYGGTGLGLSISRRLARVLGGDLEIRSELGRGTHTIVSLLRKPEEDWSSSRLHKPEPRVEAVAQPQCSLKGQRLLLAEDGPDNQALLSTMLRRAGAEVEIAADGLLALEAVENADAPFDLILMDMAMPRLDGEATTKELRRRGLQVPIVALTAHAMQGDREHFLEIGCDDFASKPIRKAKLLDVVSRNLDP